MITDTLKEILSADFPELVLKKSALTKADIKPLADGGDLEARLVLLYGLTHPAVDRIWTEDFEDDETHEMVPVERHSLGDTPLFAAEAGEVEALSETIGSLIPSQSTDTLHHWWRLFFNQALHPAIPEELARRGDADAILAMEEYNYSPLEHPQDLADDFDPRDAAIRIDGPSPDLDEIEKMVEDLTRKHGTPDNECGLFVPLEFLFETLGFRWVHDTGNLMRITRCSESVLSLEIECNPHVDEALVEAFQKAYPKHTVESIEN